MSYQRGREYPPRKRQRGGGGGGGDYYDDRDRYRAPRLSLEESILTRLRKDFISIADPKNNPQITAADDIDYVAKSIVSDYQRAEGIKNGIHELLYNCIIELPLKIPYFASLFVVANARKQVVGKDMLEFIVPKITESLEQGELVNAKLLLRFLAGLGKIVEEDGMMNIIGDIVSNIEGKSPNLRTDNLAYLVLLTLPYIAVSPSKPSVALSEIVDRLVGYMDSRDTHETSCITPFKSPNEDSLGDFSCLHLLWLQIKSLKENEWDIPFLPRPWFAFRTELESGESYPLPSYSLSLDISKIPPLEPEYYFSMFLHNEKQTVPELDHLASSLIRDVITDTTSQLVFNRKEAAHLLVDLQSYFPTGLFHRAGLPLKDLPTPQPSRPKYKLEDVLLDAIFSQLFRLPRPRELEVYYTALLAEITKLAPQDVAPTLGRGIRWLYEHLDNLKGDIQMRFSTWFAIHLSNFAFTYKWEEWIGNLELDDGMPKKVFLRETIDKEVRLSYLERIQRTLPEEYFAVFPRKPEIEEWKPLSDRFNGGEDSEKLIEALRARDETAITEYIDSNPNSGDLLIAATLYISHETPYSHSISSHLLELIKQHTTPSSLIGTIMSFWRERLSTGTVLVMKYVDLGAISFTDVISWLLSQDEWMHQLWAWEMIQIIHEKASRATENEMQVDSNESSNETSKTSSPEILEKIISDLDGCFERQNALDKEWLKEWFAKVVRLFGQDVEAVQASGWVGEILSAAQGYYKRVAEIPSDG